MIVYPHVREVLESVTNANTLTLEVGCGPGQYRAHVKGQYVGIDLKKVDNKSGTLRNVYVVADVQQLPFHASNFDCVFFCGSLYQVPAPGRALDEARRVLKEGGRILIFDYNRKMLKRLRVLEGFGQICWSQRELRCLVISHGFRRVVFGFSIETGDKPNWKSYVKRWLAQWLTPLYVWFNERREGWAIVFAEKRTTMDR